MFESRRQHLSQGGDAVVCKALLFAHCWGDCNQQKSGSKGKRLVVASPAGDAAEQAGVGTFSRPCHSHLHQVGWVPTIPHD